MTTGNELASLDGASGNIFHVDLAARSFELLKETVIDPQTNEGRSRFTVSWSPDTRITRVDEQNVFTGVEGTVIADISLEAKEADQELAAGRPFITRHIRLLCHESEVTGLSSDGNRVVALLTPSVDEPRQGTIEWGGQLLQVTLPGPRAVVEVHRLVDESALGSGFWGTTISGEPQGDGFVIDEMKIYPKVDPRDVDDPALPRVLVVGDSISMNYHEAAKKELEGIANYYRAEGNCGPADRGALCMELWLGDHTQEGLHWDLIQFNHGLHDLKQTYSDDTGEYTDYQLDLETYKDCLEKEIAFMKKTGATLMWCSTTPVPHSSVWASRDIGRKNGADLIFNEAATEVMSRHPDILINDLNTAVRQASFYEEWSKGTDVHYWDEAQQEEVGKAVAKRIKEVLKELSE